jgi:hypothetical protein
MALRWGIPRRSYHRDAIYYSIHVYTSIGGRDVFRGMADSKITLI